MAIRDLIAAEIEWRHLTPTLKLTYESMSDGGDIDLGFSLFGDPIGVSKIVVTSDYNGFLDGLIHTYNKTLYPTKVKRKLYPDSTLAGGDAPDFEVSGTDYIVRFALDNYVYMNCSNIKVTVASGLYTDAGGPSNAAVDFPVTNNSSLSYPTMKANWNMPLHGMLLGFNEYQLQNDTTGYRDVRVSAYYGDAYDGNNGVDCVKVTGTGVTSGRTSTTTLILGVDKTTYGDYNHIQEYIGGLSYATFDQGELVNVNAVVYPYIGEVAFDFSAQGNVMPTGRPCVHQMTCDKNHTYGNAVAVVNTVAGASPSVVPLSSFDPDNPPDAYATRAAAGAAIQAYNNANYGRNDHGGGIIFMMEGNHDLFGANVTNPANTAYLITAKFPGTNRDNVNFTARTGEFQNYLAATFEMFNNVRFNTGGEIITEVDNVLYYQCDLASFTYFHTTTPAAACNIVGCRMINSTQGLSSYSSQALGLRVRGTYYKNTSGIQRVVYADVFIGNHIEDSSLTIYLNKAGSSYGQINGMIIANNYMAINADVQLMTLLVGSTNGPAVVNNIMINQVATNTAVSPLMQVMADASPVDAFNDMIMWGNTFLGERCNIAYNDFNLNGIGPGPRLLHSIIGNIFCDFDNVSDISPHSGDPDGTRYGNHGMRMGAWNWGNICRGTGAATHHPEAGVNNYFTERTDPMLDLKFVNDQSGRVGVTGVGLGDYHLESDSPALTTAWKRVTKYDFEGNERRSLNGSSGAYECAPSSASSHRRRLRSAMKVLAA